MGVDGGSRHDQLMADTTTEQSKPATGGCVWWACFMSVVITASVIRCWDIATPQMVIWDEHHFLRFAQFYLNRAYFIDVHPPLGKMVVAAAAWMCNMNKSIDITDGLLLTASENQWYIGMRLVMCMLGVLCVALSYLIVWQMSGCVLACVTTAALTITDTASHQFTRIVLLDPVLITFILLTVYCHLRHDKAAVQCRDARCGYTWSWWAWLVLTGACLGATVSVKYVGVFVVCLLGIRTVGHLWSVYCDTTRPLTELLGRIVRLAVGLIVLPIAVYIGIFSVHALILNDISRLEGIGLHSAEFRYTMSRNISSSNVVMYGSQVSVLSVLNYAGYLSTSFDLYPPGYGAEQQIVALDPKLDELNYWVFQRWNESHVETADAEDYLPRPVKHNHLVRLINVITETHLHAHRVPAAITKHMYQTTGFGEPGREHDGGVWRVHLLDVPAAAVVDGGHHLDDEQRECVHCLRVMGSRFKLINNRTGCVLAAGSHKYPSWGYNTWEVVCDPAAEKRSSDREQTFQVDDSLNPALPIGDFTAYTMSLPERMLEMHRVMLETNNHMTLQQEADEDSLTRLLITDPWMWPLLYRGCPAHNGPDFSHYFIGSPQVYLFNAVCLLVAPLVLAYLQMASCRRQLTSPANSAEPEGDIAARSYICVLFLAWAIHYLPFWAMNRILYFHHYLPSFYFNCMISGMFVSLITRKMAQTRWMRPVEVSLKLAVSAAVVAFSAASFVMNWQLAYGVNPKLENHTRHYFYLDSWKM